MVVSDIYFGTYARFATASKKDAGRLLGSDSLVGDVFEIEFQTEEGQRLAWLKNRFGALVGFFDASVSRRLSLFEARGWKLQALLSFVAYSESAEGGYYWGEAVLLCYDPASEEGSDAFDAFTAKVADCMSEGVRPDVELGEAEIAKVLDSKGDWLPTKRVSLPEKKQGTAIIKARRNLSEKIINYARNNNKGCSLLSWVALLALVAGIIFGLKSCGVF
jgi:hypothetical protein